VFTDDDVLAPPDLVARYEAFFRSHPTDRLLVGGVIDPVPDDLGPWPPWFRPDYLPDLHQLHHGRRRALSPPAYLWGANLGLPAALFAELGGFDVGLGNRGDDRGTFEDVDLQDRARASGAEVWFDPALTVRHRVPRQDVSPRRMLAVAFVRGRNSYWGQVLSDRTDRPDVRARPTAALPLAATLVVWLALAAAARVTKAAIHPAHRAAFRAGWLLDRLRGSAPGPRVGRLSRVAYRMHTAVLRVVPGS
jgi:hypothetical protein